MLDNLIMALDPVAWFRQFTFLDPLEEWQVKLITAMANYEKPVIGVCCRGSGKSEIAAGFAMHQVLYRQGITVLVIAPNLGQGKELFRRCRRYYDKLPEADRPGIIADTKTSLELGNQSRVIVLAGGNQDAPRSFRANLLILDEVASADRTMIEASALPSMSGVPGSRLLAIGTPAGREGNLLYEWWSADGEEFVKIQVTARDSNRVRCNPKFLKHMKAITRPEKFAAEFECQFVSGAESPFFNALVIEKCFMKLPDDRPVSPLKKVKHE
jgi:hypothetical protein